MCCQIFLYSCRHMKRIQLPCSRILKRKTSFLGPLKECFAPAEPCNHLVQGLERLARPCAECAPKRHRTGPLRARGWKVVPAMHGSVGFDARVPFATAVAGGSPWSAGLDGEMDRVTPDAALPRRRRRWTCDVIDSEEHGVMVSRDCRQRPQDLLLLPPAQNRRSIYRVQRQDDMRQSFQSRLPEPTDQELIDEIMENRIILHPEVHSPVSPARASSIESDVCEAPTYAEFEEKFGPLFQPDWVSHPSDATKSFAARQSMRVC